MDTCLSIGEAELRAMAALLFEHPTLLRGVHRWTHFRCIPRHELETVETHQLWSVWLALIMLALERRAGRNRIDGLAVVACASVHDNGEGSIGDVRYAVKQDPRVKAPLAEIERDAVRALFKGLPAAARELFWESFEIEGADSLEGRFFNAVERIGYMLYAVTQVRLNRMQLVEVFHMQHAALVRLGEEFPSCEALYAPYRALAVQLHNANQAACQECQHPDRSPVLLEP